MRLCLILALCLTVLPSGADSSGARTTVSDPRRGAGLIVRVGCGSCHIIPGITGAHGLVGPPLDHMGRRIFIAGLLRNTPENMTLWIMHPQSVVRGNAMPEMGLSEPDSKDIAAYLATLR